MEQLQASYVRAVAAAAGCTVASDEPDDGDDLNIKYKCVLPSGQPKKVYLEVQLKATTVEPTRRSIGAVLTRQRFDEYSIPSAQLNVHKIVVIMQVPKVRDEWLAADPLGLTIHKAAYWVNLAGRTSASTGDVSVRAPLENLFDDAALCRIMQRIAIGGVP